MTDLKFIDSCSQIANKLIKDRTLTERVLLTNTKIGMLSDKTINILSTYVVRNLTQEWELDNKGDAFVNKHTDIVRYVGDYCDASDVTAISLAFKYKMSIEYNAVSKLYFVTVTDRVSGTIGWHDVSVNRAILITLLFINEYF